MFQNHKIKKIKVEENYNCLFGGDYQKKMWYSCKSINRSWNLSSKIN